ncbi:MAG: hypothetical protein Kow0037_29800 [Calditrichia bacterium]
MNFRKEICAELTALNVGENKSVGKYNFPNRTRINADDTRIDTDLM